METKLDSVLFVLKGGQPIAIKWLDQKKRAVVTLMVTPAGIDDEKDILDQAIAYKKNEA